MLRRVVIVFIFLCMLADSSPALAFSGSLQGARMYGVPVLLYHNFAKTSRNNMTVTIKEFREQMELIKQGGYTVIPLKKLVDAYTGKGPFPDPGSVVISIDDDNRSLYDVAYKILKEYEFPATSFIYPSDVGNPSYAVTWPHLRELMDNGIDVQSHAFSHPNFKKESRKLTPALYERFIDAQLLISKLILEQKLNTQIHSLAYPYGHYDGALGNKAAELGYEAAFTTDPSPNMPGDDPKKLRRFTIYSGMSKERFKMILQTSVKANF